MRRAAIAIAAAAAWACQDPTAPAEQPPEHEPGIVVGVSHYGDGVYPDTLAFRARIFPGQEGDTIWYRLEAAWEGGTFYKAGMFAGWQLAAIVEYDPAVEPAFTWTAWTRTDTATVAWPERGASMSETRWKRVRQRRRQISTEDGRGKIRIQILRLDPATGGFYKGNVSRSITIEEGTVGEITDAIVERILDRAD